MTQGIPKEFWDSRFSEAAPAYGERASRLLLGWSNLISSDCRTALVPACGQGRDAVFLAKLGLSVTAVDVSPVGLRQCSELARRHGVSLSLVEADLFEWDWPEADVDLVAGMFLHVPTGARPGLHERFKRALKPGGYVFLEGFTTEQIRFQETYQSGGPPDAAMLYSADAIRDDFSGLAEISLMTGVETLDEGPYHTGPAALLRAVFQKQDSK
ncbi:MAG: SAM-dependent methyltransferase [Ponticaulis sp.]|nr:SAM-dependent methyltransferase [Ponticaulis sp.]